MTDADAKARKVPTKCVACGEDDPPLVEKMGGWFCGLCRVFIASASEEEE